eukprot:1193839-Prorocentrum_minimum.AAC.1
MNTWSSAATVRSASSGPTPGISSAAARRAARSEGGKEGSRRRRCTSASQQKCYPGGQEGVRRGFIRPVY